MRFVETPVFTHFVNNLIDDEEYRNLQLILLARPHAGALIRGSGGLRKMRWALSGTGKRGGCRIIYFWHESSSSFYMLYAYQKSKQSDLSAQQLRLLSRAVRKEFA